MFRSIVLLVGGLASLSAASLFAQDAVLGQEYGSGVHAFFMGDSLKAHERLTAAIQGGSKDPRAFYFRGLAYLRLGRPQEAATDFRKGAQLESKDVNRSYNVGKALERVQGSVRLALEEYRVDARMAALEEFEKLRKARYEALQREERRVMREQVLAAPEMPADAPEAVTPPAAESSRNPFGGSDATQPEKKPAATPPAAKKAGEAEGDNPFDQSAKPADKTPAKKNGAPADKDKAAPNGKKPADDSDPFGEKPAASKKTPPKSEKPAEKKADSDDPFAT